MARQKAAIVRRPPAASLILATAATVTFLRPELQRLLIFDRAAIASGEVWRLVTGHLVHLSTSHAFLNIMVIILAGWMLRGDFRRGYGAMLLAAAAVSGAALYLSCPSIERYGGLSGLATAAVTTLCLSGLQKAGPARWIWGTALALVALKTAVEAAVGHCLFAQPGPVRFLVVPLVHLAGGIISVIFWVVSCKRFPRLVGRFAHSFATLPPSSFGPRRTGRPHRGPSDQPRYCSPRDGANTKVFSAALCVDGSLGAGPPHFSGSDP